MPLFNLVIHGTELVRNVHQNQHEALRPTRPIPLAKPAVFRFVHGIHRVRRNNGNDDRHGHIVLALPLSYARHMRYAVMSTPLGEPTLSSNEGVLTSIDYGSRIPSGRVSRVAAHSVGMAQHNNRIPIVVPCHRVVGCDGSLTGYAGGLHFKQQLLALETRTRCL